VTSAARYGCRAAWAAPRRAPHTPAPATTSKVARDAIRECRAGKLIELRIAGQVDEQALIPIQRDDPPRSRTAGLHAQHGIRARDDDVADVPSADFPNSAARSSIQGGKMARLRT
jgi:hypothetical protein